MKVDCDTPYFIWFTGRTGSTLLCDLLDSHPQIFSRMEDFSEIAVPPDSPNDSTQAVIEFKGIHYVRKILSHNQQIDDPSSEQVVDYLKRIYSANYSACGFKFKFPTQAAVFPEVLEQLQQIEGLKVIELIRQNVLKQSISLRNVERIRGLKEKVSCNVTAEIELEPLQLDVPMVIQHARFFLRSREAFHEVSRQFNDVLPVTYEDLNEDTPATVKKVLEFLNVDAEIELQTKFFKTTPDRISAAVANYDELVQAVAGTELEAFLD